MNLTGMPLKVLALLFGSFLTLFWMGDWLYSQQMGWGKKYPTSRLSNSSRTWEKSLGTVINLYD